MHACYGNSNESDLCIQIIGMRVLTIFIRKNYIFSCSIITFRSTLYFNIFSPVYKFFIFSSLAELQIVII